MLSCTISLVGSSFASLVVSTAVVSDTLQRRHIVRNDLKDDPNSSIPSNSEINDIKVDNVHKTIGGGLHAHNYWDNQEPFVKQLTDIVRVVANDQSNEES